jgi:hypothetical protein
MKNIISIFLFLGFSVGIFSIMHRIQTSRDLNIKELETIVEKEIKAIKEFKKKHIDSH